MKNIIAALKDQLFLTGLLLILISLCFFCLPFFSQVITNDTSGYFLINYLFAVGYFIILWASGRLRKGREGLMPLFLFFILFLISAYALNREANVFEESVPWFSALLVVICVNYILFKVFDYLPAWLQHTMLFLLGVAAVVFLYLFFYLIPLYPFGTIFFFALAIPAHVFVPALFLWYSFKLLKKIVAKNRKFLNSFFIGAGLIVVLTTSFVVRWGYITQSVNTVYRKAGVAESNGLPQWISVAQHTSHGWITERALKTDLVYSTAPESGKWDNLFWRMPSRGFNETKKHDPLIMIATLFAGKPNLQWEDRVKILESLYDARHQAQERLWSGDDLITEHIASAVRIWPQFGLSYTEKTITITNTAMSRGWRDEQEGLYTFHLPEGAVVTALSLWIEGREEKSILTAKAKADSAYKTIVGKERRDPSLVHWQEGNTVSVRVFPVIAGQSRKFKLGITAPLLKQDDKLVYENIWFYGPASHYATEEVELNFQQAPKDLVTPAVFSSKGLQSWSRSGKYDPSWKIQLNEQPLSAETFSFDGQSYTVHPYHPHRKPFEAQSVYLDINRCWSRSEFEMIYDLIKDRPVYVYHHSLERLTPENRESLFNQLQQTSFSLFPLFEIKDPTTALLISKTPGRSPNLDDLKGSRYREQLKSWLTAGGKVRLFNIGQQLSPYLKSLKEFRVFHYEQGTPRILKELLEKKYFAQSIENDQLAVIEEAGMMLQRKDEVRPGTAPDHLMRLFAYNHIMQQMGNDLLTDKPVEDDIVQEAVKAYVVSPVSSLVVLEAKKDYERFNIREGDNSLQNASLKSKGAVPEPHEWALIIIAVLVIHTLKYKPLFNKKSV